LAAIRKLRADIDGYMNTGVLHDGWDGSPFRDDFCATVDAMKGHLPVPHSLNDILEKEAHRRLEGAEKG